MLPLALGCVFLPVMPSGVEHDEVKGDRILPSRVFLPVMPSGVEHFTDTNLDRSIRRWCSYL